MSTTAAGPDNNLSYLSRGLSNEAIWDVEDEELLEAARKHLRERRDSEGRFHG
jgi:hypothetical protein